MGSAPAAEEGGPAARPLAPAARRALAEAEARRAAAIEAGSGQAGSGQARPGQPELHGRGGLEPVRYGDWEVGGIAVDF